MPTVQEFLKQYGGGRQSAADEQPKAEQAQPRQTSAVDQFMAKYGSPQYKAAEPQAAPVQTTQPQPSQAVNDFMAQYGSQGYRAAQEQQARTQAAQETMSRYAPPEAQLAGLRSIPKVGGMIGSVVDQTTNSNARQMWDRLTDEQKADYLQWNDQWSAYHATPADRMQNSLYGVIKRGQGGYQELAAHGKAGVGTGVGLTTGALKGLLPYLTDPSKRSSADSAHMVLDMLTGGAQGVNEMWDKEIQPAYDEAQKNYDIGQTYTQRSRAGLDSRGAIGFLGKMGLDIMDTSTEMLFDRALDMIVPGAGLFNMGARSAGQGSIAMREMGANEAQALMLGLAKGGIEVLTEKISGFGSLRGEKGFFDSLVKNGVERFVRKGGNRLIAKMLTGFGMEAGEEILSDVMNYALESALKYNADGYDFLTPEWNWGDVLYDGLLGGILGALGGAFETPSANMKAAVKTDLDLRAMQIIGEQAEKGNYDEAVKLILDNEEFKRVFQEATEIKLKGKRAAQEAAIREALEEMHGGEAESKSTKSGLDELLETIKTKGSAEGPSEAPESPVPQGDIPAPAEGAEAPVAQADEFNSKPEATESEQTQTEQKPTAPKKKTATDVVREIQGKYGSGLRHTDVRGKVQSLASLAKETDFSDPAQVRQLWEEARDLADELLSNSEDAQSNGQMDIGTEGQIRDYLRNTKIRISEGLRGDVPSIYEGFADMYRKTRGKLNLSSKEGIGLDVAYQEMQSMFGKGLFPDAYAESDMLENMLHALATESGTHYTFRESMSEADYRYALAEMTMDLMRGAEAVTGQQISTPVREELAAESPDREAELAADREATIQDLMTPEFPGEEGLSREAAEQIAEQYFEKYGEYNLDKVTNLFGEESGYDDGEGTDDFDEYAYWQERYRQPGAEADEGTDADRAQELPAPAEEGAPEGRTPQPEPAGAGEVRGPGSVPSDGRVNAPQERIATPPAEARNDSGQQPGQKRSKSESHTFQNMAERNRAEQEEIYYTPESNAEKMAAALSRVDADMGGEIQKLMGKEMWNAEDVATGLTILNKLQQAGAISNDFSASNDWSRVVSSHTGDTARALQIMREWSNSGAGIAAKSLDRLAEAKDLTEEQRKQIANDVAGFGQRLDSVGDNDLKTLRKLIMDQAAYRKTSTFAKKNYEWALKGVKDFEYLKEYARRQLDNITADYTEKADLGQKVKTWQVNAQLSRLGTFFRNIGGNTVFGIQDTLSQDFFGVALDALIGKATGKRTVAADKGWLSSQARSGARQALLRSILEVSGDVDMEGGGSKYGQAESRTFKMTGKGFDRFMSRWEQLLGYSLTSSDRTFRGAIEAEQERGLSKFENLTDEERQALKENMADYRLFQNKGKAYQFSKGAHDVLNIVGFGGTTEGGRRQGGFGLGDLVMPYPGVPANLWAKSLEYSPANVVKGTIELVKLLSDVRSGKSWSVTQQQNAVMDVARGLHGTALIAGLAALFRAGVFKNADDEDDPDAKALAAAEGRQGVQINLSAAMRWLKGGDSDWQQGDKLMKIDWLEPMNAFLAIASLAADDLDDPGAYMKATAEGSVQALLDMPVMTSISNIMDSYKYSKAETTRGKLAEVGINFGVDSLTGLLPAPISQAARAMDPYYRETVGETAAETALNRVMNAIPGLRQMLDPKLDNFGRPKEQADSAYDRWMNSFVRPGQISDYKAGEMEQALDALAERTGDPDVYPDRKAPNSFTVKGEKFQMDNDQKQLYQNVYGDVCNRYYSAVLTGEEYDGLSDEEKSWVLDEIRSYATYRARSEVLQQQGRTNPDKNGLKTDSVLKAGVDLPDYLIGKRNANEDGEGSLKNTEVFGWLWDSDYTAKQQAAIWDANHTGDKSWSEYKATNPVAILADFGINASRARDIADAIDPEWSSIDNFSQDEMWEAYKAHPKWESYIERIYNARGFTGKNKASWEEYKAYQQAHGK